MFGSNLDWRNTAHVKIVRISLEMMQLGINLLCIYYSLRAYPNVLEAAF